MPKDIEVLPRIVGTESEWGFSGPPVLTKNVGASWSRVMELLPEDLFHVGSYLSNGARYYLDANNHVEYATPECMLDEIVAHEIAGERITSFSLNALLKQWQSKDPAWLDKRVHDGRFNGASWGYHENYLISRAVAYAANDAELARGAYATHAATRSMLFGAGMIKYAAPGDPHSRDRYVIAQKIWGISEPVGSGSLSSKALINTRDEPLSRADRWRRVHFVAGDNNISPWATFMKLATTSLVFRLMEHKVEDRDLRLVNPLHEAKQVARDPLLRARLTLAEGEKTIRAITLAQLLQQRVVKLAERVELPKVEQMALGMWGTALEELEADPQRLDDRVDWIAKQNVLRAYQERLGLDENDFSDKKMKGADIFYPRFSPAGTGIRMRDERGHFEMMPSEEAIRKAMTVAPQTTRACIRGEFIRRAHHNDTAMAEWGEIEYEDETVKLDQPYAVRSAEATALMDRIAA